MPLPHAPSWHLLGAGCIGTLLAAALQRRAEPPTLVLRRKVPAVTSLTLISASEEQTFTPPTTTAADRTPIERLLITTKAHQSVAALESVAHRLRASAVVVLLHNGFGPQQAIAERWPQLRVYAGTTTEGAYRREDGRVVHAGRGDTWLGPINPAAEHAGSTPLAPLLGLDLGVQYDPAITTRLWQKLALNAVINGLTVIHDCPNGELAHQPALRAQMAELCAETEAVAQALNQPLFEQPLLERALAVAEATASNYSSMLQDVRHGRHTELDSINGTLCRLAEQHGIAVPNHRWLVAEVQAAAAGATPAT